MRSGSIRVAAFSVLLLLLSAGPALAAGKKKSDKKEAPSATATATPVAAAATPTAAPAATPDESVSDADLPTVDDDPSSGGTDAAGAPGSAGAAGDGWEGASRGGGMIAGLRLGVHAFDAGGIGSDGGLALEGVWAMPLTGPFYLGAVAGYHTGYEKAGGGGDSNTRRFFDAEFFAVEGQWRHNLGRVNVMGGVGAGALSGNSAVITLADGSTGSDSGTGFVAHVVGGAEYQVGRVGLAAEARYGFSPVGFQKAKETIPMGGLTLGVGFDLGF